VAGVYTGFEYLFLHMLDAGSAIWYDVDLLKGRKINADKK
jgi:hypothetical protein